MKKSLILAGLMLIIFMCSIMACKDKEEDYLLCKQCYLKNNTNYVLNLRDNFWRICKAHDSIEFISMELQHNKNAIYIDSTLLVWYIIDDNKDSSIIVTNYNIPLTSINRKRDHLTMYECYSYSFTDSLFQNIKDSMAIKGYYPQLHETW